MSFPHNVELINVTMTDGSIRLNINVDGKQYASIPCVDEAELLAIAADMTRMMQALGGVISGPPS